MQPIPSERDPIAERDGRVSLPWRAWFDDLRRQVESGGGSTSDLAAAIEAICRALGSPDGTPENIPDDAGTGAVIGQASIRSFGQLSDGRVLLTLANDSDAPGATYCYGTDTTGAKGWFPISDALAATANITLTVGADGVTTVDLADLADSGTGNALVKITRDAKGRVSGTSAATTDDLAEGPGNLYHTAARVRAAVLTGLSTATNAVISATDTVLSALGKLQAQITAHVGRTDNPHSVTAAQAGAVASIVAGSNVSVDATDPQNPVVSSTGGTASMPPGYIDGLRMVWVSGTALTVTSGAAYIEGAGAVLQAPADIAKAGLSLTASTWHHVYLFDNAGTPDVEIVTDAPAAPYNGMARSKTGDPTRRYVGSVRTDGAGALYNFSHSVNSGFVSYKNVQSDATFRALAGGANTTETVVSLASAIPMTSNAVNIRIINTASSPAEAQLYTGTSDDSAAGPPVSGISAVDPAKSAYIIHPVDAAQAVTYWFRLAPVGGFGYMDVYGYIYDR